MQDFIINLIYIVSVSLFLLGLKKLSHPKTAREGNLYSFVGMLLAIIATLLSNKILSFEMIILGILLGGFIGVYTAYKVQMTSMPQTVAAFNGLGGLSSVLIATSEYIRSPATLYNSEFIYITLMLSLLIGMITFSGSMVAFGKLHELIPTRPIQYPLQKILNAAMLCTFFLLAYDLYDGTERTIQFYNLLAIPFVLGITLVIPIGGADMPVIVSLLNSYSGIAVAMTGFIIGNYALVVVGTLVGASGLILTNVMCKGMNRSIWNVLFGGFGATSQTVDTTEKPIKVGSPEEMAMLLEMASSVIIIPGYGMAVSQAQHVISKLTTKLIDKDINVTFAIHPVAGRMPGHMNVLLAEANIEYDILYDMDRSNDLFPNTDIAIVIGANDVVNPDAKNNPESPIFGMPILNADQAKHVFVLKRSMNVGFAGIPNNLFHLPNTTMVFGDAKSTVETIINNIDK